MFKISPKTIVLGGLAIAAAAGALKNRDKVAGLIGARSSAPEPPRPEPSDPAPPVSNYDVDGPAQNMATHVPAPEPTVRDELGGIDERAEERAAAAEAAAIGGPLPEYPGTNLDESAEDAVRPLAESGAGESEGEELADFDLRDEAESRAGETSDASRQIEDTLRNQDNPGVGESIEAIETSVPDAREEDDRFNAATADDADETPTSTATNGNGAPQSAFGFAGGKVGAEPEEGAGAGLPDPGAVEAVEAEAEEEGPEIHPDQTSLLEEGEEGPKETSAAEKSSAVWEPPASSDQPDDDDDGGSEWQTWSGRAIRP